MSKLKSQNRLIARERPAVSISWTYWVLQGLVTWCTGCGGAALPGTGVSPLRICLSSRVPCSRVPVVTSAASLAGNWALLFPLFLFAFSHLQAKPHRTGCLPFCPSLPVRCGLLSLSSMHTLHKASSLMSPVLVSHLTLTYARITSGISWLIPSSKP